MKPNFFTKKRIIAGVIILVAVLICGGVVYAADLWNRINHDKMSLFNTPSMAPLPTASVAPTTGAATTGAQTSEPAVSASPTASLSPEDLLKSQADPSILQNTLNVLLIGTDYADDRYHSSSGAYKNKIYFNSDVMIVLAINFKLNKVDMISVPRDSYAKVANMDGIYKLNFSMSAGGGMNDKGYMNVCKSVEYMLDDKGRIPINYYIAGSIPAVKQLTDMVGGVDFNVDMNFRIDNRTYKKGMQHLDGQGVLDYCRVRKNSGTGYIDGPSGDIYREGRQRAILMEVFKKLRANMDWLNVPKYLVQMQGSVSTNLNVPQLAALTLFAKDMPMRSIAAHQMQGTYNYGIFGLNYVLIDQSKRVQLIKDVYKPSWNVEPQYKYDPNYAKLLWAYMQGDAWIKSVNDTMAKDANQKDKKKFTDPATIQQVNDIIKQTHNYMAYYKGLLYNTTKPVVSAKQVTALTNEVYLLHNPKFKHADPKTSTYIDELFLAAGYRVNWDTHIYVPEALKMLE